MPDHGWVLAELPLGSDWIATRLWVGARAHDTVLYIYMRNTDPTIRSACVQPSDQQSRPATRELDTICANRIPDVIWSVSYCSLRL